MAQVQLPPRFPSTLRVDPVRTKDLFTKKVLFRGGDPAKDLYLLVDGQVAITVENTDFSYPVDEAGGVFGWSALANHGIIPQRRTSPWKARFSAWMANG